MKIFGKEGQILFAGSARNPDDFEGFTVVKCIPADEFDVFPKAHLKKVDAALEGTFPDISGLCRDRNLFQLPAVYESIISYVQERSGKVDAYDFSAFGKRSSACIA